MVVSGELTPSEVDDATLVARAGEGDVLAFEALVRRHQRPVYALCLRMLDGAADAAGDAARYAFLTAWRQLPEAARDGAFPLWLLRLAVQRCLRVPSPEPSTAAEGLTRCLGLLSPRQRVCWLLREMQGLSYADIAYVAGTTEASARTACIRARVRLAAEVAAGA